MFGLPSFIIITIEYIYFCYGLNVSEITTSCFFFRRRSRPIRPKPGSRHIGLKLFENIIGLEPKIAEVGSCEVSKGKIGTFVLSIIIGVITPWYIAHYHTSNGNPRFLLVQSWEINLYIVRLQNKIAS